MTDQVTNALVAGQKLVKKLRQLRNRGDATEQDVTDAKAAVDLLRGIAHRNNINVVDWDSRAEKKLRHNS